MGSVTFIKNDAEAYEGGAIYLLSSSQIILSPGAHVSFINNTGRYACKHMLLLCSYSC